MKYLHDCNNCVSLGDVREDGDIYELYYHPNDKIAASRCFIARYGDDGQDYICYPEPDLMSSPHSFMNNMKRWYLVALNRAKELKVYEGKF